MAVCLAVLEVLSVVGTSLTNIFRPLNYRQVVAARSDLVDRLH